MTMNSGLPGQASEPTAATGELSPNIAAALSYFFGLLGGVIFILISKDRFVRFHAFQSLLLVGVWVALWIATVFVQMLLSVSSVLSLLGALVTLFVWLGLAMGGFVLWLVLIVSAYQGKRLRLPVIGNLAEQLAVQKM